MDLDGRPHPIGAVHRGNRCARRGHATSEDRTMGRWSRARSRRYAALFDSLSDAYDQSGVPFFGQIARGLVEGLELRAWRTRARHRCGARRCHLPARRRRRRARAASTPSTWLPAWSAALTEDAARRASRARGPGRRRRPAAARAAVRRRRLVAGDLLPRRPGRRAHPLARPAAHRRARRRRHLPALVRRLACARRARGRVQRASHARRTLGSGPTSGWPGMLRSPVSPGCAPSWPATTSCSTASTSGGRGPGQPRWAGLWRRTPETAHPEILRRATAILERSRRPDGRIVLEVGARYTFGVA